ncbi:MAG: hypothetical protein ACJAWW_001614 [Sulfurimonas sp.]|jgi:hypothetical protein
MSKIIYRKDLDRPLTSDEVDSNFSKIINNHGATKLDSRTIIMPDDGAQQFSNAVIFILPIPLVPEYNFSIPVSIKTHKYNTLERDNVKYSNDSDNFDINVLNNGAVTHSSESFDLVLDSETRELKFISNMDVSGYAILDFFIEIDGYSAVFTDCSDEIIEYF